MKRKTLNKTKAEALQKLGTLKSKVKDTIKTRTKNVSFIPSIYKLLISLYAFVIKTLWLDKITSNVAAKNIKLLNATFRFIIKANLLLAVAIYIAQVFGVENAFTYELYIYLGYFLYYAFRDTILDYTGNLYDLIKNGLEKIFSKLHEVKVNVDNKNNLPETKNNVTQHAKNSYNKLKEAGKLDEVQPKHRYSDWSKTIMILAAVCVIAFCFYCYDPDNFTKGFKFIGDAIWSIPKRFISAVKAIPGQINYLYTRFFRSRDINNVDNFDFSLSNIVFDTEIEAQQAKQRLLDLKDQIYQVTGDERRQRFNNFIDELNKIKNTHNVRNVSIPSSPDIATTTLPGFNNDSPSSSEALSGSTTPSGTLTPTGENVPAVTQPNVETDLNNPINPPFDEATYQSSLVQRYEAQVNRKWDGKGSFIVRDNYVLNVRPENQISSMSDNTPSISGTVDAPAISDNIPSTSATVVDPPITVTTPSGSSSVIDNSDTQTLPGNTDSGGFGVLHGAYQKLRRSNSSKASNTGTLRVPKVPRRPKRRSDT